MPVNAFPGLTGEWDSHRQERTMTQQTGRHHMPFGVFVDRALLLIAIIGLVAVLVVGFL
jgi:hypothetical protein